MEPLDLNNVIEVKEIKTLLKNKNQREVFNHIIKIANIRINNKGLDRPELFTLEPNIEPDLSDHSSDEEFEVVDESD
jgi:hypothetical protein